MAVCRQIFHANDVKWSEYNSVALPVGNNYSPWCQQNELGMRNGVLMSGRSNYSKRPKAVSKPSSNMPHVHTKSISARRFPVKFGGYQFSSESDFRWLGGTLSGDNRFSEFMNIVFIPRRQRPNALQETPRQ